MRKKIVLNIGVSLALEIITLVCAFILPRMIMVNYGSEYNGVVTSVSQFLATVSLLRGGVTGVTRAALYKPLKERNIEKISGILKATERFMRRIACIFAVSLVLFAAIYPLLVSEEFGWFYTATLVLILGISTVSQYYFGLTYQILLQADQRQYIYSALQIFTTIVNTLISVILINLGMDFRIVKLSSGLIFGVIPLFLYFYAHKHYKLLKNVPCDDTAIAQRWDAFLHHVAAFIHLNTDVILLTVFCDLYQVAVYTVYSMVTNGVKKFASICSNGIEAAIGTLLARNDSEKLSLGIDIYEWVIHVVSTVFFVCTAMLIVPFVMIYTSGVQDTNYFRPALGYVMCLAQFFNCIRLPYQNTVEAAGHFRQTRSGAILEAGINIFCSIPCVILWGATGVVIGTVIAILFRTVQYAWYISKNILVRPFARFVKRCVLSGCVIAVLMYGYFALNIDAVLMEATTYFEWVFCAFFVFWVVLLVTVIINSLAYPALAKRMLEEITPRFFKRGGT